MNNTIYKYGLEINNLREIRLPVHSRIVGFRLQGGEPTVWILQNLEEKVLETRHFLVVGTGWNLPSGVKDTYGTVETEGGLVWHLLEVD